MNEISKRIIELRELTGYQSGTIADLCGWKAAKYSHLERGRSVLSLEDAETLCNALAPFIGDRYLYLTRGLDNSAYFEAKGINENTGMVHQDAVLKLFKGVIQRAIDLRVIAPKNDSVVDSLISDFAITLSRSIESYKEEHKKAG